MYIMHFSVFNIWKLLMPIIHKSLMHIMHNTWTLVFIGFGGGISHLYCHIQDSMIKSKFFFYLSGF